MVASTVVHWIDGEVAGRVTREPECGAALAKWRDCVERAGYTPTAPEARALTAAPTNPRANVVNAMCGARAGVPATGERLERRIRPLVERESGP